MAGPQEILPGSTIGGRYRVERLLGQGGMGAVYVVRHTKTDERLALKVLHASIARDAGALARFRREARMPATIDSDHVVRVTDADTAAELDGAPFIVMDLLRGRDLEREVEARGALPPAEVVHHLRQAARALDKAHARGIIHRDLKPENLFVATRKDGTTCLKVLDFGIAKITSDASSSVRTAPGSVFGTPMYMAPEQVRGAAGDIGPWTDVWALGLVAHKLLTGRAYWVFDSLPMLVLSITHEPMPPPSARDASLGPTFDAWFARCCARVPTQRFPSAGEAIDALDRGFKTPLALLSHTDLARAVASSPEASAPPNAARVAVSAVSAPVPPLRAGALADQASAGTLRDTVKTPPVELRARRAARGLRGILLGVGAVAIGGAAFGVVRSVALSAPSAPPASGASVSSFPAVQAPAAMSAGSVRTSPSDAPGRPDDTAAQPPKAPPSSATPAHSARAAASKPPAPPPAITPPPAEKKPSDAQLLQGRE
jgi:serine/threonine-protein kinase